METCLFIYITNWFKIAENVANQSCRNVIRSHDAQEEKGRYNDVWQVQTYDPLCVVRTCL